MGLSAGQLIEKLRSIVGDDGVLDSEELSRRAASYWDSTPLRAKALVRPRSTEEVSAVLKLCAEFEQAVVAHGGLTGVVDGTNTEPHELILSLERMDRIEEIDPIGRTATVQAGVILQHLQENVARHDLIFPLDLGARGSCTIGGNVATNAGGINVIRYGMMREMVLGLEAVLANGTVIRQMNRMLKNNAGYDLKQLFIGTEGTLGVVTRAVVKLKEAPSSHSAALVALERFDAVTGLLKFMEGKLCGQLSSYEVMWGNYFKAVTEPGYHRAPMSREHAFYVVMEATGADRDHDAERFVTVLEEAVKRELLSEAIIPKSEAERAALWAIREDFEAITDVQPTFLYDVSLPIRHMDQYTRQVEAALEARWPGCKCYVMGHLGDGNLHLFVSPGFGGEDLHADSDREVYGPLKAFGGSVSAEHGIGMDKKSWLDQSRSEPEIELMRLLKRSLDPKNLLNPGKIFDA